MLHILNIQLLYNERALLFPSSNLHQSITMKVFKTLAFAQGILACRQIPDKLKRIEECPVKGAECGMIDGDFKGCPYGELCIPSSAPALADYWSGKCISCLPNIPNKARCIDLFYDKGKRVVDECMEKCHIPDLCAPGINFTCISPVFHPYFTRISPFHPFRTSTNLKLTGLSIVYLFRI